MAQAGHGHRGITNEGLTFQMDDLAEKLRAQALKDRAFADIKARIEAFDSQVQDPRTFYLHSVLTWLSGMTYGEIKLLAPLIKEKLGIDQTALFRDVHERQKQNEVITENLDEASRRESQANRLIGLFERSGAILFHDQFNVAFAWVSVGQGHEVIKVRSRHFRLWLARLLWEQEQKAPSSEAMLSALNILEARARFDGPHHTLFNRVAQHEAAIWYDLGGPVVKITPSGWEIMQNPSILFYRYSHQHPQIHPIPGGDLRDVLKYVNLPGCENGLSSAQLLFLVYLATALIPDIPHPVLCVQGVQGSGKTTFFKIIRDLIDPSATPTLGPQDDLREFIQLASHHWVVLLDNLGTLPEWMSDAICRCVTGEGFSKRELYSDDEDVLYSYRRCVGINGINLVASKADLLDRALIFSLERISSTKTEEDFWVTFRGEKARILGAIFTVLGQAMAEVKTVKVTGHHRMADFVRWGLTVTRALGFSDQTFYKALADNTRFQVREALEASPVAQTILKFMDNRSEWEGYAADLLKDLNTIAQQAGIDSRARLWPKDTRWLWRRIQEVRPNLKAVGLSVDHEVRNDKAYILINRLDRENDPAVPANPATSENQGIASGNIAGNSGNTPGNDPDHKSTFDQGSGDTGNTGDIFSPLSGDDGTGYPTEIPGMGKREIGSFTGCNICGDPTWARYGRLALCKRHALKYAKRAQGIDDGLPEVGLP